MAKVYDLLVRARGETKDAERAMKQLQRHVKRTGDNIKNVGKNMSMAITGPLIGLGIMGAKELGQIEKANAQTAAAIERLGPKSRIGVKGIQALSAALQEKSGIDDQAIQTGANLLLSIGKIDTRTRLGEKTMKIATRSMVEFAEQTGVTAEVAGKQYAASMAAAANGTLKLPRGMKLGKEETLRLKAALDGASTSSERQAIVANALSKQFAGSMKLTNADKWAVSMDKLAGMGAQLVTMLLPALEKVANWIGKLTAWFDQLSPRGQKLMGMFLLIAAAIGPLLVVIGTLVSSVAVLIPVLVGITLPMIAIAAAIAIAIAAGVALYLHWDEVKVKLSAAWDAIKTAAVNVWTAIKTFLTTHIVQIVTVVLGPIAGLVVSIAKNWSSIRQGVADAWATIRTTAENWSDAVVGAIGRSIDGVVGRVRGIWADVRGGVADAWKTIRDTAETWATSVVNFIVSAVEALPGKLKSLGAEAGAALANALKGAVNAVIGKWNDFHIPAVTVMEKEVTPRIDFPNMDKFARGGIATRPSIFGEAGPEAAVPLGLGRQASADRARVMQQAGLGGTVVNVYPPHGDTVAIAERVALILRSRRVQMGGAF